MENIIAFSVETESAAEPFYFSHERSVSYYLF